MGVFQNHSFKPVWEAYLGRGSIAEIRTSAGLLQARRGTYGFIPSLEINFREGQPSTDITAEIINGARRQLPGGTGRIQIATSHTEKKYSGLEKEVWGSLIIDLRTWTKPDKKRTQNINKAIRAGCVVADLRKEDIPRCSEMAVPFAALHGLNVVNHELLSLALTSPVLKGMVVSRDNKIIAFEILLLDKECSKSYSWVAAWTPDSMEINAPSLLTRDLIQWSKDNGFKEFDFGQMGFGSEKENNILRFKQSFGGEIRHWNTFNTFAVLGFTSRRAYLTVDWLRLNVYSRVKKS